MRSGEFPADLQAEILRPVPALMGRHRCKIYLPSECRTTGVGAWRSTARLFRWTFQAAWRRTDGRTWPGSANSIDSISWSIFPDGHYLSATGSCPRSRAPSFRRYWVPLGGTELHSTRRFQVSSVAAHRDRYIVEPLLAPVGATSCCRGHLAPLAQAQTVFWHPSPVWDSVWPQALDLLPHCQALAE